MQFQLRPICYTYVLAWMVRNLNLVVQYSRKAHQGTETYIGILDAEYAVGADEVEFYEVGERLKLKVIPQQIIKA